MPALAPLPDLPADVTAAIADYRPLKMSATRWALIADTTRWACTAYRPPSPRWLSSHGGYVARFVAWVAAIHVPPGVALQPGVLLGEGLIEHYLADGFTGRPTTTATVRSVLRRTVANMSTTAPAIKYAYQPVQAPYTPAECAALVRTARHQPTTAKRRALSAVVALGLGAGLDGRDQRLLRACDITEIDVAGQPALLVAVPGPRPRTVVVRAGYEALLREALTLHAEEGFTSEDLLHGRDQQRQNVISAVTGHAVTATGTGIALSAARMRTTWLCAVACAPVPLAVLLTASGLTTARTLADLLPYCPPPPEQQVARLLHDLSDPKVAQR